MTRALPGSAIGGAFVSLRRRTCSRCSLSIRVLLRARLSRSIVNRHARAPAHGWCTNYWLLVARIGIIANGVVSRSRQMAAPQVRLVRGRASRSRSTATYLRIPCASRRRDRSRPHGTHDTWARKLIEPNAALPADQLLQRPVAVGVCLQILTEDEKRTAATRATRTSASQALARYAAERSVCRCGARATDPSFSTCWTSGSRADLRERIHILTQAAPNVPAIHFATRVQR
jgi:hypothetical protein